MGSWTTSAVLAAIAIGLHYTLLRAASGRVGDTLGALVLESTAAAGIALTYVLGLRGPSVPSTRLGLFFSAISGLGISAASILIFASLRRGGPVAATGAIVLGGGVAISALVAPWAFGETWSLRRVVGVAFAVAAIVILSRDPGTKP